MAGAIQTLLRVGLWQKVEGGWTVGAERWANWQSTKEAVEEKLAANRARTAKWRESEKRDAVTGVTVTPQRDADVTLPEHKVPVSNFPCPILTMWNHAHMGVSSMVIANVRSRVVVALNECGNRIGETHHNAWIPDVIVDLIRYGHEDYGWGYLKLADMFSLSKNTVRKICTYERRAQTPQHWKTLREK